MGLFKDTTSRWIWKSSKFSLIQSPCSKRQKDEQTQRTDPSRKKSIHTSLLIEYGRSKVEVEECKSTKEASVTEKAFFIKFSVKEDLVEHINFKQQPTSTTKNNQYLQQHQQQSSQDKVL